MYNAGFAAAQTAAARRTRFWQLSTAFTSAAAAACVALVLLPHAVPDHTVAHAPPVAPQNAVAQAPAPSPITPPPAPSLASFLHFTPPAALRERNTLVARGIDALPDSPLLAFPAPSSPPPAPNALPDSDTLHPLYPQPKGFPS
jgi:hypothetical protein